MTNALLWSLQVESGVIKVFPDAKIICHLINWYVILPKYPHRVQEILFAH